MNLEKEIKTYETGKYGKIKSLVFSLIAFVLCIFMGIVLMNSEWFMSLSEYYKYIPYFLFVLSIFIAVYIYRPSYKITLYDNGIKIIKGKKEVLSEFKDIDYIIDYTDISRILIIPINKVRTQIIFFKDGTNKIVITQDRLIDFNEYADELAFRFSNFLLKDITTENIKNSTINFGPLLKLENGELISMTLLGDVLHKAPIDSIISYDYDKINKTISFRGLNEKGKDKQLFKCNIMSTGNVKALYRIIDEILPKSNAEE